LPDRLKARIVAKYGIIPGTTYDYRPMVEFLSVVMTDILAPAGIALNRIDTTHKDIVRVEFSRGVIATQVDFWIMTGKTRKGKPKPPMFSQALWSRGAGTSEGLADEIRGRLARTLI